MTDPAGGPNVLPPPQTPPRRMTQAQMLEQANTAARQATAREAAASLIEGALDEFHHQEGARQRSYDFAVDVLHDLIAAGWVDPEEAAQRQKFVERLKQLLGHAEVIVAERDALLSVAEAAKAWAAAVHAASAAGILTPGRSAGDASDAARDAGDRLAAAVDTWESRKETTDG